MTIAEARERAAVIAEAESWRGTPFHLSARKKGIGCDCAQLLLASYAVAGIATEIAPGPCSRDWFFHHEDTRFIDFVKAIGRPVDAPQPGDTVLFHIGRSWAHAAIVAEWPLAIHARWNAGVEYVDCSQRHDLGKLQKLFFSPWQE